MPKDTIQENKDIPYRVKRVKNYFGKMGIKQQAGADLLGMKRQNFSKFLLGYWTPAKADKILKKLEKHYSIN